MLRGVLTQLAQNQAVGGVVTATGLMGRVVGGQSADQAVQVAAELAGQGFLVSLERASAEHGSDADQIADVQQVRDDLWSALSGMREAGLGGVGELTVYPGPFGALPVSRWPAGDATQQGVQALVDLVRAARAADIAVVLGTGPDDTVAGTLALAGSLAEQNLPVGITVAAALRRCLVDIQAAKGPVRIVKGGYDQGPLERFHQPLEVDKSFVRCTKVALRSPHRVCLATHDPRLVEIGQALALRARRRAGEVEFAMYLGRASGLQRQLRDAGQAVRVGIPFGPDGFARLVGALAERPSGLVPAIRSLLPGA